VAPHDDLRLERLAELHLVREHQRLGDDLLREGQRARDVVDVGRGVLGGLRARERVAGVLAPVGQHHDPVGLARRQHRQRQLDRLEDVRCRGRRPAPSGARCRARTASAWSTTACSPNAITLLRSPLFIDFARLGDEPVRALARGEAHAVREVQQETRRSCGRPSAARSVAAS
jgi:hypothetical protein